jgi:PAS domain S-box-containing protein
VAARRERDRLLETSENLIAITDPAGRLTLVSPSWTRTLGYGPDELLGHMLAEFIHPDDLASDGAAFLAAVNHVGRVNGLVNRGRARDGTYRWLEWNGTRDPETGQLYASALDITEHRRADLALLQSEGWYRTLADSLPHLVWTCRADGPCDYLSPRWVAYTGVPESEQLGYRWLEQLHPDDRDRVIAEWAAVAARGESFDIEFRIRRADGVFRWFRTRAIPFRDNDGQLVKWFGSNTDIDDSKRGEQELRELNAELDGRVTQRTIALEAANRELEAFSYSVSHDLRAPLRSIDAFSQILLNEYAAPLDAEGRRILGIVLRNVKQMGALIDDLLAFARVTRKELDRRHVDMTSLARSVADELQAVEPDRTIAIDIGSLADAPGDGALLHQVWANLLGNAVKFSRPVETPRVEVRSEQLDGEYRYTVRDNGVGFDPTYVDKLFKPFSRLHPTAEFEGTGIGLAIVARIVGRHGGRVWAEGTPGTGATFGFALPAEREAP